MTAPLVRAVVVSYEGGDLTLASLRSLLATDWPPDRLDIVLVDNASRDGVAATVEREMPSVRVVRSTTNRGFAGGCNLGLAALGHFSYVALVNNDATVEPGWLHPLVATLEDDPALGAACPKILLPGRFREVTVDVPTVRRGGRDLGIWVSGARVEGVDVWPRTQLVRGFWGVEPPPRPRHPGGQWTAGSALVRVPVDGAPDTEGLDLQVSAEHGPLAARVRSGDVEAEVIADRAPAWVRAPLGGPDLTVVNNVGSRLTPDGHGADRGYLEPDDGRFDTSEDVFAWCGAAVLLRREYLDDVGAFDERLFVYYEDLELSWRGATRGWRYRSVPESVVHHLHAATTREGSRLKTHYEERNRLLVLTRHAAPGVAWRAALRHLLVTASYARRDVLRRLLHGRRPRATIPLRRLRAFVAFVLRAPGMLRSRRHDAAATAATASRHAE